MPIIRYATPEDIAVLTGLLRSLFAIEADFTFNSARQARGLRLMLDNPRGHVLVAEALGEVVGMCTGQILISSAEGGPACLVEDVVVREEMQGRGAGTRLLAGIADWARENRATRLQLLADRNNLPALGFYENNGWSTTELVCLRKPMRM